MPKRFPGPSPWSDIAAREASAKLDQMGLPRNSRDFTVITAELDNGQVLVALSGANDLRNGIEISLIAMLRLDGRNAIHWKSHVGQTSSLRGQSLNPRLRALVTENDAEKDQNLVRNFRDVTWEQKFRVFHMPTNFTYDCAEPKILEGAAKLRRRVVAMTTFWYGRAQANRHIDNRGFLGGGVDPRLSFMLPCPKCQANEGRMMEYHENGWMVHGRPRFGSYESPF